MHRIVSARNPTPDSDLIAFNYTTDAWLLLCSGLSQRADEKRKNGAGCGALHGVSLTDLPWTKQRIMSCTSPLNW